MAEHYLSRAQAELILRHMEAISEGAITIVHDSEVMARSAAAAGVDLGTYFEKIAAAKVEMLEMQALAKGLKRQLT